MMLATMFKDALYLASPQRLLLILPLCLAVAVVYKTTRCADVKQVPMAALILWVTIVIGMYAVGVGLWLMYLLLA
ncbi:MAG TPA: hypothetical protein PKK06_07485 [Phycisphaerae bacterium]|nr:hypothetical protein [Phycisphaerae bacterium]HNU46598.1 hypothetical protein [Phycisphaerae bacterium]